MAILKDRYDDVTLYLGDDADIFCKYHDGTFKEADDELFVGEWVPGQVRIAFHDNCNVHTTKSGNIVRVILSQEQARKLSAEVRDLLQGE